MKGLGLSRVELPPEGSEVSGFSWILPPFRNTWIG